MQYILVDRKPTPEPDPLKWRKWFRTHSGSVAKTCTTRGDVSTVFLPFVGLFETMIFGGPDDGKDQRYKTWDAAVAGHQAWVAKLGGKRESA